VIAGPWREYVECILGFGGFLRFSGACVEVKIEKPGSVEDV
jgi:hypothetical protein